jgi:4-hydroxy-2-oxoheptanedioate aldolase
MAGVVPPYPAVGTTCTFSAMPSESFKERLRGGEPLFGGWLTIGDPLAARAMAAAGLDYVVIDLQHGGATERDLPAITTAIRAGGAVPVGRVRHAHTADLGRALDLGCAGVIVPNVESAEQTRTVVGACHYPPAGYRSGGGVLAGQDEPFCVIMVESRAALADLEQTLGVPGVDAIYVGPRDLSYSLGCQLDPNDPVLRPALEQIWAACAAAGRPVGVHATDGPTARLYRENGCRLVTVAADGLAITRTAAANLDAARK